MQKRKIIKIDESLCDGCALCIPSCPEGTLQIINGKAKLVKESFCDGLGACSGDCPTGALTVVEVNADEYDEVGVTEHLKTSAPEKLADHLNHLNAHRHEMKVFSPPQSFCGCPSSRAMYFEPTTSKETNTRSSSQLRQWPIQLHLVQPNAQYFKNADIILVADCVPFAYPNFHDDFLKGNAVAIGCPKLDDVHAYVDKVTQIFRHAEPKSIKVVIMEVPCCSGLAQIARQSLQNAGLEIPLEIIIIGIRGDNLNSQKIFPNN
jgi:ferredoxin